MSASGERKVICRVDKRGNKGPRQAVRVFAVGVKDRKVRARFRSGYDREVMLTPNSVGSFEPGLWGACNRLAPVHRLRVACRRGLVARLINTPAFGRGASPYL
jgi:predicted acyl esterase